MCRERDFSFLFTVKSILKWYVVSVHETVQLKYLNVVRCEKTVEFLNSETVFDQTAIPHTHLGASEPRGQTV